MTALFISDLHLSPHEPEINQLFFRFIDLCEQKQIKSLYILGDFFNYWIGNDSLQAWHEAIIHKLKHLSQHCRIYFLPGNRDFLVDQETCDIFGFELINDDYKVINIYNKSLTILHGDTLCTKDISYQWFRKIIRSHFIKKLYLFLPLQLRLNIAKKIKNRSNNKKIALSDQHTQDNQDKQDRYDAVAADVKKLFQITKTSIMIHGHTHRPKVHIYNNLGKQYRYVLGDWHKDSTYYLEVSSQGIDLKLFSSELI